MPSCPVCGGTGSETLFTATDRLYRTTAAPFAVVQCRTCGLTRLHPQPEPAEIQRYYPQKYWFVPGRTAAARLEETYRRLVLRDHLRFVGRAIRDAGEDGLVVDVGCGGGLLLAMLRDHGHPNVAGIDLSLDAARAARSTHGVPVVCATLPEAPFAPQSCAAITMFHVLEHLYDPRPYLASAWNLLRPGGRLIVQTPNAACWQFLLLGRFWNGLDVPRHLFNYRDSDLEKLLESCGFQVLRRKHFSLRDNPAGLATSLAPGLDPMARRLRKVREGPGMALLKDMAYFALTAASVPFTALEAACHRGSTIMLEARRQ